jgi:hypothetical protein
MKGAGNECRPPLNGPLMQQSNPDLVRNDDAEMFELAPVSLWLEDYSGLKQLFAAWRHAGVTDLRDYLLDDPWRIKECSELIKLIKVNRATLTLCDADDFAHLAANLGRVFRDDMLKTYVRSWSSSGGKDQLLQQHGQLFALGPSARHPAQGLDPPGP